MNDPLFSMALVTGFLSTGHCLGMCGGIVAALALAGEGHPRGVSFHLLYNLGRIATYSLIGFSVGWLGSAIAFTDTFRQLSRMILVGSDLMIILLGIGSAGLVPSFNLLRLECRGNYSLLSSLLRPLQKFSGPLAGLPIGLLLGFLPCGLLYAMAITAAQSADPQSGALILLAFGVGTAPGLLLFGGGLHWLGRRLRQGMLRGAGLMVALMGAWNFHQHGQLLGWW